MKKCRLLLAAGLLMFLTGCFSQSVEEFRRCSFRIWTGMAYRRLLPFSG